MGNPKIGDVVKLKSGTSPLVIIGVDRTGRFICCRYIYSGHRADARHKNDYECVSHTHEPAKLARGLKNFLSEYKLSLGTEGCSRITRYIERLSSKIPNLFDSTPNQKDTPDMTTLYKILPLSKEATKTTKAKEVYGTYRAKDSVGRIVVEIASNGDSLPAISAFKPEELEEVVPWTFHARDQDGGTTITYSAPKDCLKAGDIILSASGRMYTVLKVDTREKNNKALTEGWRKVSTEPIL